MSTLESAELEEWMRELLPVRGGVGEMCYVSNARDGARVKVTLRLLRYESAEPGAHIADIKEQEMVLAADADDLEPKERVRAMLEAWASVLGEVLAALPTDRLETLMPHDLFPYKVLRLARSHTAEDFAHALRAKSRLGAFLGPSA